jgi:hypothetical protein
MCYGYLDLQQKTDEEDCLVENTAFLLQILAAENKQYLFQQSDVIPCKTVNTLRYIIIFIPKKSKHIL